MRVESPAGEHTGAQEATLSDADRADLVHLIHNNMRIWFKITLERKSDTKIVLHHEIPTWHEQREAAEHILGCILRWGKIERKTDGHVLGGGSGCGDDASRPAHP